MTSTRPSFVLSLAFVLTAFALVAAATAPIIQVAAAIAA